MVVQVFCDDSGNAPDQAVFSIAGLVANADRWSRFGEQWSYCLARRPALEYVKYSEAKRLRGQFEGWSEADRNKRLQELSEYVAEHALARFFVVMRHSDFQRYVQSVEVPFRSLISDQPFLLMVGRLMGQVVSVMSANGVTEQCEFIFDTQPGPDAKLVALWPDVKRVFEEPLPIHFGARPTPRIGDSPRFENERDFLPLQAADLLAGAARDQILEGATPAWLDLAMAVPEAGTVLNADDVADIGERMAASVAQVCEENPGLQLFGYNADSARRERRRARRKLKSMGDDSGE